jgi:hypothetical protein
MDDAELRARLARIEEGQAGLRSGMAITGDAVVRIDRRLTEILTILNAPSSGELEEVLRQLAASLDIVTRGMVQLDQRVASLPAQVAEAVRQP